MTLSSIMTPEARPLKCTSGSYGKNKVYKHFSVNILKHVLKNRRWNFQFKHFSKMFHEWNTVSVLTFWEHYWRPENFEQMFYEYYWKNIWGNLARTFWEHSLLAGSTYFHFDVTNHDYLLQMSYIWCTMMHVDIRYRGAFS